MQSMADRCNAIVTSSAAVASATMRTMQWGWTTQRWGWGWYSDDDRDDEHMVMRTRLTSTWQRGENNEDAPPSQVNDLLSACFLIVRTDHLSHTPQLLTSPIASVRFSQNLAGIHFFIPDCPLVDHLVLALITHHYTHQLEMRKTDLNTIRDNILKACFASIWQFEWVPACQFHCISWLSAWTPCSHMQFCSHVKICFPLNMTELMKSTAQLHSMLAWGRLIGFLRQVFLKLASLDCVFLL